MRAAMAAAPVGDIQYGDDPTVNALEDRVADLLGKEAGLWVPSGTMANQIALKVLTQPGDDVIVATEAHSVWHEAGASAANAGVQLTEIGSGGAFTAADFSAHFKPNGHPVVPGTTLVEIENTHNRMGGTVFEQTEVIAICDQARGFGIASYLDGARLWNASIASGQTPAILAAPFDLAMVSFSKGLGAPGGSMLTGPRDLIDSAVRHRRMFGGAMRQVGIYAAAIDYALTHNFDRIHEDHENARQIARELSGHPHVDLISELPETNIVVFDVMKTGVTANALAATLRDRGILIGVLTETRVRLLTHLDVGRKDCLEAAKNVLAVLDQS
jgi:threonine aldolase